MGLRSAIWRPTDELDSKFNRQMSPSQKGAGLNGGLFSETMDFRSFPSVLSAVRIAQS